MIILYGSSGATNVGTSQKFSVRWELKINKFSTFLYDFNRR